MTRPQLRAAVVAGLAGAAAVVATWWRERVVAAERAQLPSQDPADVEEARRLVGQEVGRLRALSYEELVPFERQAEHRAVVTSAGTPLVLEIQGFWDDGTRSRVLRVDVSVSDPQRGVGDLAHDVFFREGSSGAGD